MSKRSLAIVFLSLALLGTSAVYAGRPESVLEKYDNGKNKVRYYLKDGKKDGKYFEWYENGRNKVRAEYRDGELHGTYREFNEKGKPTLSIDYKMGKKNGEYKEFDAKGKTKLVINYKEDLKHGSTIEYDGRKLIAEKFYIDGEVAFPRSIKQLEAEFARIDGFKIETVGDHPKKTSNTSQSDREAGLKQQMKYRYLCGQPYEDMVLDVALNTYADYAALVLQRIGRLSHHPKNPGMKEEDFKLAYKGTSQSNLAMAGGSLTTTKAMDMWMDDSDPSNIDRIGHRRWMLNPPQRKIGISAHGGFSAGYCFDKSRKDVPEYSFIAFPAPGFNPGNVFKTSYAWHVTLNKNFYKKPSKDSIKVNIYRITVTKDGIQREGKPLPLEYFNVDNSGIGTNRNAIIFRPRQGSFSNKSEDIFQVEVSGLQPKYGKPDTIKYYVRFYESDNFKSSNSWGRQRRGR